MNPEPEMCLDLATWQEFCGFDLTGCNCDLHIEIDSEELTMEVTVNEELPAITADDKVETDYFGNQQTGDRCAGPFAGLKVGKVKFNIDPRKL